MPDGKRNNNIRRFHCLTPCYPNYIPWYRITLSHQGDKITHPTRTIFNAGFLDNGEGRGCTEYDDRCVCATPSTKYFEGHHFCCVSPPTMFGKKPGLQFCPRGCAILSPSVIVLYRIVGTCYAVLSIYVSCPAHATAVLISSRCVIRGGTRYVIFLARVIITGVYLGTASTIFPVDIVAHASCNTSCTIHHPLSTVHHSQATIHQVNSSALGLFA